MVAGVVYFYVLMTNFRLVNKPAFGSKMKKNLREDWGGRLGEQLFFDGITNISLNLYKNSIINDIQLLYQPMQVQQVDIRLHELLMES